MCTKSFIPNEAQTHQSPHGALAPRLLGASSKTIWSWPNGNRSVIWSVSTDGLPHNYLSGWSGCRYLKKPAYSTSLPLQFHFYELHIDVSCFVKFISISCRLPACQPLIRAPVRSEIRPSWSPTNQRNTYSLTTQSIWTPGICARKFRVLFGGWVSLQ